MGVHTGLISNLGELITLKGVDFEIPKAIMLFLENVLMCRSSRVYTKTLNIKATNLTNFDKLI